MKIFWRCLACDLFKKKRDLEYVINQEEINEIELKILEGRGCIGKKLALYSSCIFVKEKLLTRNKDSKIIKIIDMGGSDKRIPLIKKINEESYLTGCGLVIRVEEKIGLIQTSILEEYQITEVKNKFSEEYQQYIGIFGPPYEIKAIVFQDYPAPTIKYRRKDLGPGVKIK